MRIYLDNIIFSLQRAGGISAYWGELCQRLHDRTEAGFIEDESARLNIFREHLALAHKRLIRGGALPAGLKRYIPNTAMLPEGSIFHTSYYRTHLQRKVANVVTVYDFIYEFYRKGVPRAVHRIQKWFALQRADGIICISTNTARDLKRVYPNLRCERSVVIPLAASGICRVIQEPGKDGNDSRSMQRAILFVGDRMPYKNFRLGVQTVSMLPGYRLWIVGRPLSNEEARYVKLHLGNRFDSFENLDPHQLNLLYNRAFCLLYPSEYEGFGIPILEAMQAGCPVIAANGASAPEVAGSAGLMTPGNTAKEFAATVRRLEDETFRKEMICAGLAQARKFSWDRCAEQTLNFYHEVFHAKFGYL